jgi:hypothetical protein
LRLTHIIIVGAIAVVTATTNAASQPAGPTPNQGAACPPDVKGNGPTIGDNKPDLSGRLADSKGVICPPAGVDPDIQVTPPGGGQLKVITPPGSPGGNPDIQPK